MRRNARGTSGYGKYSSDVSEAEGVHSSLRLPLLPSTHANRRRGSSCGGEFAAFSGPTGSDDLTADSLLSLDSTAIAIQLAKPNLKPITAGYMRTR